MKQELFNSKSYFKYIAAKFKLQSRQTFLD